MEPNQTGEQQNSVNQSQQTTPDVPNPDMNIPPTVDNTNKERNPKRSKKMLLLITLLVVLLAAGAGSYLFLKSKKSKTHTTEVPKQDSNVTTQATTEVKQATAGCLGASDFKIIYKDIYGADMPKEVSYGGDKDPIFTQTVFFNSNSQDFTAPQALNENVVKAFASFYKLNSAKQFKIKIQGGATSTKQPEIDLGNARANKVKDMLVKQGVSNNVIVVEPAGKISGYSDQQIDTSSTQPAQNVVLSIDPSCKQ